MANFHRVLEAQNSGVGANMPCTSYLPHFYHIPGAGGPLPMGNGGVTWGSGTGYIVHGQPFSFNNYMVYGEELVRQTMLRHESAFRYQVHELHRLYGRQKEMMNELKRREFLNHHLRFQISNSDRLVYPMQSGITEKTTYNPGWPSVAEGCDSYLFKAESFQGPRVAGESCLSNNNFSLKKNDSTYTKILSPKKERFGKKRMLDLELLPDQYIESDEENNGDGTAAEVPTMLCCPKKETPDFIPDSGSIPSTFHSIGSPNRSSGCGRTQLFIDLNEPIQFDESDTPNSSSHVLSVESRLETGHMDQDLSHQLDKESKFSNVDDVHTVIPPKDKEVELLPLNSEAGSLAWDSSAGGNTLGSNNSGGSLDSRVVSDSKISAAGISSSHHLVDLSTESTIKAISVTSQSRSASDLRKNPLAVQALPCFNTPQLEKGPKSACPSSRIYRDRLQVKKSSANNSDIADASSYSTVISRNDPTSVQCRLAKRMKNSQDFESLENLDLNSMPPRCFSDSVAPHCSLEFSKASSFDDQFSSAHLASCNSSSYKYKKLEKVGEIVCSFAHDPASVKSEKTNPAEDSITSKSSRCIGSIDLNSCMNEDEPPPALSQSVSLVKVRDATQRDLEAPVSPENKECPPPRGESEEMQVEGPLHCRREDGLSVGDLDVIAAEAIITMSSSQGVTYEPPEPFSDCLKWFAGIVSSATGKSVNEVEIFSSCAAGSNNKVLGKPREKKVEVVSYSRKNQNDEDVADESLPKLRGRRSSSRQQNAFKKKAHHAPGIGRRATGVAFDNVTKRKRNTGECGITKRKLSSNIHRCNFLEQFMHSPPSRNAKESHVGRALPGWGSATGQRKARRARTVFDNILH